MRSLLALGLLIIQCASAGAATVDYPRHHVIVRPGESYAIHKAGLMQRLDRRSTMMMSQSYNDSSRYGGGTALPAPP
jgi:hypothetical protein